MNSDPATAHRELRQAVRDFATAVVKPMASRTDHEHSVQPEPPRSDLPTAENSALQRSNDRSAGIVQSAPAFSS